MPRQHFDLQFERSEINSLAEEYWKDLSTEWQKNEKVALDAGLSIREGAFTRENLRKIVYWKSSRVMPHIEKNSEEAIREALQVASDPATPSRTALEKLMELRGVGLPVASAILTAIYPEHYTVIDYRALQALGYLPQSPDFYMDYLNFCKTIAAETEVVIQEDYPAPTQLRALDRALWQWSTKNEQQQ